MKKHKKTFLSKKINPKSFFLFVILISILLSFSFLLGGLEEDPEGGLIYAGNPPQDGWYCADEEFEEPEPDGCSSGTQYWGNCSGWINDASDGQTRTATDTSGDWQGEATYQCDDGSWQYMTSTCEEVGDPDPDPEEYTLTVSSDTGGWTTPSEGTHTYEKGTEVYVYADADTGYEFTGWSGDCSGTSTSCGVTMNSNKSVHANFTVEDDPDPEEYGLTITSDDGGSTSPSEGRHTYEEGERVIVTASSDTGYEFTGWSGDCSGTRCSVTMDSNKSVHANFEEEEAEEHRVNCSVGAGEGSTGRDCGTTVEDGGSARIAAHPDSGWEFVRWDIDGETNVSRSEFYTIENITDDVEAIAFFREEDEEDEDECSTDGDCDDVEEEVECQDGNECTVKYKGVCEDGECTSGRVKDHDCDGYQDCPI